MYMGINLHKEAKIYSRESQPLEWMGLEKVDSYVQENQTGLLSHTMHINKLKAD